MKVEIGDATLYLGDCLDSMKAMPDNSVDSIVTDPPYGLSFMGEKWDYDVPSVEIWAECLRVLKPGGHLLAFAGTRTQHRMAVRIEDAGFEIRDIIAWVYGSGFPKSLDVSKAIDKMAGRLESGESVESLKAVLIDLFNASSKTRKTIDEECGFRASNYLTLAGDGKRPDPWAKTLPSQDKWAVIKRVLGCSTDIANRLDVLYSEAEREVVGQTTKARSTSGGSALPTIGGETIYQSWDITAPATEAAQQWQGWGTALKPALEPITVARKPLIGTVAENVLEHGTGGVNIDGCRVGEGVLRTTGNRAGREDGWGMQGGVIGGSELGRWPANLIHDGSDEVVGLFPQSSVTGSRTDASKAATVSGTTWGTDNHKSTEYTDKGSAARFFYCAKASKRDRDEGLEAWPEQQSSVGDNRSGGDFNERPGKTPGLRRNVHPTVKPTDLMRYLCRLVTPPNGVVLDPFMGSGSTGKAAMLEGFGFIGCEMSPEYFEIACARIESSEKEPAQQDMF
jgi:DNA modification methylase